MTNNSKVSVIIPHHQGRNLILHCLNSLTSQTYSNFETIVVDNASHDGSIEVISRDFLSSPLHSRGEQKGGYLENKKIDLQLKIITLPNNEGFAYAINLGVRESQGDILAFLNNDTEVEPDWIQNGVNAFLEHPEIGILASRIMDFQHRDIMQNTGIVIHRCGRPSGRGRGKKYDTPWSKQVEVFGASGGAMMVRKSVWDKVEPFREDFVMYLEDVDWAFRARLLGEKCLYIPNMMVYHHEASTQDTHGRTGVDSPERVRKIARNKLWVLWLNTPWQIFVLHLPFIVGGLFYSLAYHTFKSGRLISFLMGTLEGKWGILPRWKQRRLIQKRRKITIKELRSWYNREQ
jgi:GT2 family glycosyltransferase